MAVCIVVRVVFENRPLFVDAAVVEEDIAHLRKEGNVSFAIVDYYLMEVVFDVDGWVECKEEVRREVWLFVLVPVSFDLEASQHHYE